MNKKIFFGLLVILLAFGLAGCDDLTGPDINGNTDISVTGVTLNKTSISLEEGDVENLTATVAPEDATNKDVSWKSSNTAIATVDSNGKVTAVAAGSATITVTTEDGGKTATCTVTVTAADPGAVAVTGVTLNKTTLTLTAGASETLIPTVVPANATNKNVSWISSNTAAATVDNDGKVSAIAAGSAIITVTTTNGGKTATCTVTVQAASSGSTTPATPGTMTTKSALQYFNDEGIKAGWNLGNTLDAVNVPSAAIETAWGNPAATQQLLNGVKESGFDIVRIGCTWIGHIGSAPDYKVSEARLQRVAEVVNMVHSAGMKAIINIHHDGNYTSPPNTWGFVKFAEVMRGEADKAQVQDQLSKVWTQIAEYFKNYGDNLIFETMNEVHSGNWGGGASTAEQDMLFDWNQAALNAIRATGGNNATRFVAVPGLGGTEPGVVIAANNRGKLLPNDGANGTNKLIVSVHFYAPSQYTVAEATPTQGGDGWYLKHTLTSAELAEIDTEASHIKTNFIDKGIAVYYGEWGAPTETRSSMSTEIKNTHTNYIGRVAAAARANGIVPIIWDDGGNFKMLERSNGRPKTGLWADTLTAYMNGINNTTPPPSGGNGGGDGGGGGTPTAPTTITGNLGNYAFGLQEDNVTPNYQVAQWNLSADNVTKAKTDGAQLVLQLTNAPTADMALVWQGPASNLWWEDTDILENGIPTSNSVNWDDGTKTLTVTFDADTIDGYATTFKTQSSLNLLIGYWSGGSVNDLGITSANIVVESESSEPSETPPSGTDYSITITIQPLEDNSQRVFYDADQRPVFYKGKSVQFVASIEASGTWPTESNPSWGEYFKDTKEEILADLLWEFDDMHNYIPVGQHSTISDDGLFTISRDDTFAHYIDMGSYYYEDPANPPSATVRASPKVYNTDGRAPSKATLSFSYKSTITDGVTTVAIRDLGDNRNDTGRGNGSIQEVTSGSVTLNNLDNNNVYVVKVNATGSQISASSIGSFSQTSPAPAIASLSSASLVSNTVQSVSALQSSTSVARNSRSTVVNSTKDFYVETSVGNYTTKEATLLAAGTYGNIWVVDSLISTAKAQEMASAFDIIYPAVTAVYGYEYGGGPSGDGGKDGDTMIQILVQNIPNRISSTGGATSGLFMEKDFGDGTYSNQAEMFYIDATYLNDGGSMSILAHEFQHLINYNQKTVEKTLTPATWFNELLSVTTEDFTQAKLGAPAGFSRVGTDGSSAAIRSLTSWSESIRDYGNAALFGGHLLRNYGGVALFKSIMENDSVDIASLTAALLANGSSLEEVFNTIAQSMIFTDDIKTPAGAKTYGAKSPETVGTTSYTLSDARQFFDNIFYESTTARALDAYSVEIYSPTEWKGYTGDLSINFNAPSNNGVKVYLIVR